jgi:hypothetical protein
VQLARAQPRRVPLVMRRWPFFWPYWHINLRYSALNAG